MSPRNVINAVAVDLDGTMVRSTLNYALIRRDVLCLITSRGIDPRGYSVRDRVSLMFGKAMRELASQGRDVEVADLERDAREIIDRYEVENAQTAELLPGARDALTTLRRFGLKLGLFTASGRKAVKLILEAHRLGGLFQAVVTRDDVGLGFTKPRVDHLLTLIDHLSEKPEATLVVGDSTIDMIPAAQLGASAVGVEGGVASAEELRREGALDVIPSLSDLPRWIEEKMASRQIS